MRRPRPTALVLAVLCAPACFYDSMSAASSSAGGTTTAAATTADSDDAASTTDSPPPDDTTSTETETTAAATTAAETDPETTAATTDDPVDTCGAAYTHTPVPVADAKLEFPMVAELSMSGEGKIASSAIDELGTVDFTVELSCADEYTIWVRVFDAVPGSQDNDPDAYYAQADDGPEVAWIYGCDTTKLVPGWSWQRVRSTPTCDTATDWAPKLGAGTHHIVLRNREGAAQNNKAAVARILVTNDPNIVPAND